MMVRTDWTKNEQMRVPRARELKYRVMLAKVKDPVKKAVIETSDLSQPQGLPTGWLEAPRPRKMVLPGVGLSVDYGGREGVNGPVCMERKHDHAL